MMFELDDDTTLLQRTVREFAENEVAPAAEELDRTKSFPYELTEPEAGSDAGNTRTRARLQDGEWVINGAKQFITNAGTEISGLVCITARTGGTGGGAGAAAGSAGETGGTSGDAAGSAGET